MKREFKGKQILSILALVFVLAAGALIYYSYGPKETDGTKYITIGVIGAEQEETEYEFYTDAVYLRDAMEDVDGLTFEGEEAQYGMMIDTVNGVRADYELDKAYWSIYVNGAYCKYGIDKQPVNDKDEFTIVYTPAEE